MASIRPRIAITMGDPTGVGPEIIVKALAESLHADSPANHSTLTGTRNNNANADNDVTLNGNIAAHCDVIVVGRPNVLRKAALVSELDIELVEVESISQWTDLLANSRSNQNLSRNLLDRVQAVANPTSDSRIQQPSDRPRSMIYCLSAGSADADAATEPRIDARGGQAAYDCLVAAANHALAGEVDAIVTAPLQKVSLHMAGHDWPGHTELLADLCGVDEHAMMLYLPPGRPRHGGPAGFGVVHVTLHMALREVFDNLSIEAIYEKIRLANTVFHRIRNAMQLPGVPKIAVAALNPHGGEGGRFGNEETSLIEPAVQLGQRDGIDVVGPLPVDTLMPAAVDGKYDAVVAMYHDQGHIALKLLDMFDAVNITLGLPILRTSVAHGTAHDIAWQNRAQCSGMVQAILTAARLAPIRH